VQPNFRQQNHRQATTIPQKQNKKTRQAVLSQTALTRFSIQFLSIRDARQPSLHPGIPIPAPYFALLSQYMHRYTRFSRSVSLNT